MGQFAVQEWDVRDIEDEKQLHNALIEPAAQLRAGGLIAFPTETVYGLGANAWDESAVQRIFQAKGRPSDNPLIVHIARLADLHQVVPSDFIPNGPLKRAMQYFWPGPLTIIMPVNQQIAQSVHPQIATVGVRMPAHPVARALIQAAGCPVAAPSANQSGRPSPTTAIDVREDMDGRIVGVVDGGACQVGLESTVVAIETDHAIIYRPGGITRAELAEKLQIPVYLDPHLTAEHAGAQHGSAGHGRADETIAPKSPGMKYRHYAPNASVHVWWGDEAGVQVAIQAFWAQLDIPSRSRLAIMAPADMVASLRETLPAKGMPVAWVPEDGEPYVRALSRILYHQLRAFDRAGVEHIFIYGVNPNDDVGAALMNRLQKAAEGRIHRVE